uniref:Uncharacterized protein n=1 Tax=Chlorobium chlorochromatii (strain CaD3) TaxID=340177 RepID=Q3AS94_CHLCH
MSANLLIIGDTKARALYDVDADALYLPISGRHLESAKALSLPLVMVDDEGIFLAPSHWKRLLPESSSTIDTIERGLLKMGRDARQEL